MKNNKGFSIKNLILTILFIIIIVILVLWIISMRKEIKSNQELLESATKISSTQSKEDGNFDENMDDVKAAAAKYFVSSSMPSEVGDSKKITLKELIDKGFIKSIKDQSKYNLDESYAKLTRTSNEYVMKVYLKSNDKTDYKIYYFGNYEYCQESSVCEKNGNGSSVITNNTTEEETNNNQTETNNSNSSSNNSSRSSNSRTSASSNKSNTSYSVSGNTSRSGSTSRSNTSTNTNSRTSNSGTATRTTTTTKTTKTNVTTKTTVTKKITKFVKKIIKKVTTSESSSKYYEESEESEESTEKCTEETIYEYKKETEGKTTYTDWSEWTKTEIKPTSTREVEKKTTRKLIAYKVTKKKDLSKPIFKDEKVLVGTGTTKVCTQYATTTTVTNYTEKYVGTIKVTSAPTATSTVRYEKVGAYNWYCDDQCTSGTVYLYKVYQRVPSTSSSTKCSKYETKTTAYEATKSVLVDYETIETKEPVYEYNTYYRYRDIKSGKGTVDIKWSHYNDTTLLNKGYEYTGNKKTNKVCN